MTVSNAPRGLFIWPAAILLTVGGLLFVSPTNGHSAQCKTDPAGLVRRRARRARRLIACYGELSKIRVPHQRRLSVPHLQLDLLTAFCHVRTCSVVGSDLLANFLCFLEQRFHLFLVGLPSDGVGLAIDLEAPVLSASFEVRDAALQVTVLFHQPLTLLRQILQLVSELFVVAAIRRKRTSYGCIVQSLFDLVQFTLERTGHFVVQRFSVLQYLVRIGYIFCRLCCSFSSDSCKATLPFHTLRCLESLTAFCRSSRDSASQCLTVSRADGRMASDEQRSHGIRTPRDEETDRGWSFVDSVRPNRSIRSEELKSLELPLDPGTMGIQTTLN
jgi:hypothetical protein